MKVLIIGYPKTGTKSMHAALKVLGYQVYDYEHNFYYLRKEWTKILSRQGGTKEDFYNMYKDVDATMDMPACVFWKEILEAFPDVKLIFTDRKTEEDWWRSWDKQAENINNNKLMTALAFLSPTGYSIYQYSKHVARVTLGAPPQRFWSTYRGISPTVAKMLYRNHNAEVKRYRETVAFVHEFSKLETKHCLNPSYTASKDQLLTFNPSQGWEPLCQFLGKPIPKEDFPHKNKGGTVLDDVLKESPIFHQMKREMAIFSAVIVVIVAFIVFKWLL